MRVAQQVLDYFRATGRGYQTRINQALRKVMVDERKKSSR